MLPPLPAPTIKSNPPNANASPFASFSFTDFESGVTFQCKRANFSFTPASITISAGCSVTWTQTSVTKHTPTSNTGVWDSGQMSQNDTFTWQLNTAGSYPYKCMFHPGSMHGTITVT